MADDFEEFARELGRLGEIPLEHQSCFAGQVEKIVCSYRASKNWKTLKQIEAELEILKKRVERCLKLRSHKTWRPGKFHARLEDLSRALAGVSPSAREYLRFRTVELSTELPDDLASTFGSCEVVDPIRFQSVHEQVLALELLWGAIDGPVALRCRGRPTVGAERALHHMIAAAYDHAVDRRVGRRAVAFMAVCEEIKRKYDLSEWNPESIARSPSPPSVHN